MDVKNLFNKSINFLLIKGNKFLSETLLINLFKNFNKNLKKKSKKIIKFIFIKNFNIFKIKSKQFNTLFYNNKKRIIFIIKNIMKFNKIL